MSNHSILISLFCLIFSIGMNTSNAQNIASHKQTNTLIQPPFIKKGDTIAIVAPSGILKNRTQEIKKAKALLNSWGLHVVLGKHLFNQNNHFAGTDYERYEDLQSAMDDKSIKAIWCARGGYGTVRVLDKLNYSSFKKNPKWIIGYSDITALHNQLHIEGFESVHAMMCSSLQDNFEEIEQTIATFKDALFGEALNYTLKGSDYNKPGTITAPIVGGNLTVLQTMLGSKTSLETSGKILFIEEIGEYLYSIDRMIYALKRSGYFEKCNGLIIGDISKIKENSTPFGQTYEEIILEATKEYNFPILFGFPSGHEDTNKAIFLGREIKMKIGEKKSTVEFRE